MLLNKKNYLLSLRIPILPTAPLPISKEKFKDLQVLKKFCSPQAAQFFDSLPTEIEEAEMWNDVLSVVYNLTITSIIDD